nr:unnamed protein product [Callosobruchus analis]
MNVQNALSYNERCFFNIIVNWSASKITCSRHLHHCNVTFKSKVSLVYQCLKCVYQTTVKNHFNYHMSVHPETATGCICAYCDTTLKSKPALDDHMVRKHPDLATPVGRKIFECPECSYRTIQKSYLANHMLTHFKTFSSYKLSTCVHCQATFKSTRGLDDHVVRNHPNFFTSVARKNHECSICGYKTILKYDYDKHNATVHPETPSPRECLHCDSAFTSIMMHAGQSHITSKLYECTECHYKTTMRHDFNRHTAVHQGTTPSCNVTCIHCKALTDKPSLPSVFKNFMAKSKFSKNQHQVMSDSKTFTCIYCDAVVKSKNALTDHVVKKHSNFITPVTNNIYECTQCVYKTVKKHDLYKYASTHSKSVRKSKFTTCAHCNAKFKTHKWLDAHIVKTHPEFVGSVTRKIYECTVCPYKTIFTYKFDKHLLEHTELASRKKINCSHCDATFKSKVDLDKHVVQNHYLERYSNVHNAFIKLPERDVLLNIRKDILDDHVVRKHPNSAPVGRKIFECTECRFKTVKKVCFFFSMAKSKLPSHQHQVVSEKAGRKSFSCFHCDHIVNSKRLLISHLKTQCKTLTSNASIEDVAFSKHSEPASNLEPSTCIHCHATFKSKIALNYHVVKKHPSFITSVTKKTYECSKCLYKTIFKHLFDRHMSMHPEMISSYTPGVCIHCKETFKNKIWLDDHVVRKHPNFIASVTSKLYECTQCVYKTVIERSFDQHMSMHSASTFKPCLHCNATFKSRDSLNDHVLKKHPDFESSINRKIYTCTICNFKTTIKNQFERHMTVHSGTPSSSKTFTCIHCDAMVKSKNALTDHVVRKHPNFITSVTNKIYECAQCVYKTVKKHDLYKHSSTHSKPPPQSSFSSCVHCNTKFKTDKWLDAHIVKTHPEFVGSVTRKIYECAVCPYKTIFTYKFDRHMLEHTELASRKKIKPCNHCDATFKSKGDLDEHVVRRHSTLVTSPSRKIFECTQCVYKTTRKKCFVTHTSRHPAAKSGDNLIKCIHCNAILKSKRALEDHVVRKHPNSAPVDRKIFECTECRFKTVMKGITVCFFFSMAKSKLPSHQHQVVSEKAGRKSFSCFHCDHTVYSKRHIISHLKTHYKTLTSKAASEDDSLLKHSNTTSNVELNTCIHCNATFKNRIALNYHVLNKHPSFITSDTKKTYKCTKCFYRTIFKHLFDRHTLMHPQMAPVICIHCNETFRYKIWLDDHVVKKHPDFITAVTSKLYSCAQCNYKTVIERMYEQHLSMHLVPKRHPCIHCSSAYKDKDSLNDHVILKHPDFVSSITKKIYECARCNYKTVKKSNFARHTTVHSRTPSSSKTLACIHCDAVIKSKNALTDHVVRKHPNFNTSVTNKIYECKQCIYRTVKKTDFDKHSSTHSKTVPKFSFSTCVHCNAKFKTDMWLDAHIVKTHPEFVGAVTSKIYECTVCPYKTIFKYKFDRHLLERTELASRKKINPCNHCDASFKSKPGLDEHMVRRHSNLITSLFRNIFECTQCVYKTTRKKCFAKHTSRHPTAIPGDNLVTVSLH